MSRWSPKEIRQLRVELGLTQERMAHKLGVSFATVNRWEKGRAAPTGLSLDILDTAQKEVVPVLPVYEWKPEPPPVKVRKKTTRKKAKRKKSKKAKRKRAKKVA